jgi:hypothetical protein
MLNLILLINGIEEYKLIIYLLLNVRFGSLLGPRGLLLIYIWGENSKRKPCNLSPCLLGLAYLTLKRRLRVTYSTLLPYFLTFLGTTAAVISL